MERRRAWRGAGAAGWFQLHTNLALCVIRVWGELDTFCHRKGLLLLLLGSIHLPATYLLRLVALVCSCVH
jgi:hypothetical protein